ncbi:MAG: ABC transporter ATP-binding protein/permease [Clostridiales bacterium]|jgi:ATP-binding cassette subfamily B protein|nr:ABC transporter ATP-binding protein/permease [Clostridiales bacterium]
MKKKQIIKNNLFMLKILFQEAPVFTIFKLSERARSQTLVFFEHVYMIGFIIDAIVKQKPFWHVLLIIGIILAATTINPIFDIMGSYKFEPGVKQRVERRLKMALYEKASKIDLKCYDDPVFYNDFVWAMSQAPQQCWTVMMTFNGFIGNIVGLIIVGGYMISQDMAGLAIVLVAFAGVFFFSAKKNKLNFKLQEKLKPYERKRDYISRVFYLADYAKEIRANRIKKKLVRDFNESIENLDKELKGGTRILAALDFIVQFVFNTFLVEGIYLMYLLYQTIVRKVYSYGVMVTLYNSCGQLKGNFLELARTIPQFQENTLYINKIKYFLEYPITVTSPETALPIPGGGDITLKNVSFSYEKKPILQNICLSIPKGAKVAFVGYNGAGKTTLVKLIMRLYDPDSGTLLYGGHDVKEYSLSDYRNQFAAVFQDFQIFAAPIRVNITMDSQEFDKTKADVVTIKSGLAEIMAEHNYEYDTQLTKEFDDNGVIFSGGQAQSLAITRSLYKDSNIMIMDEPSSALDPKMEYNLNKTMFEVGKDKTVITISHRLSTTKTADKIYMFEKGCIIEEGSHDELMQKNGKYAEMFLRQAQNYNISS